MRKNALLMWLALCLGITLAGCDHRPGPVISSDFPADVQAHVLLTDGTAQSRTFTPCRSYGIFDIVGVGFRPPPRTVFVEKITVSQDGAVVHELDGHEVEAIGARGGAVVIDASGIRWSGLGGKSLNCARIYSAFATDVEVRTVYDDGETAAAIWQPCTPRLWLGSYIGGRRGDGGEDRPRATRMTVARDGDVVLDLAQPEIEKTFRDYYRGKRMVYVADPSGFTPVPGVHIPPVPACQPSGVGA